MSLWEAIFLGIVQGLTEFLPVSSSGHLVITQFILGVEEPGITFEVFVHFGTLVSILWVFYPDIVKLFRAVLWLDDDKMSRRLALYIIIGSIPAGIVGLGFHSFFVRLFSSLLTVGLMLLVTGSLLWFINQKVPGKKTLDNMSKLDAIFIGIFQALAIFPGISRSGATITAALFKDLNQETAVRFSFLLTLPAILGATLLEVLDIWRDPEVGLSFWVLGVGTLAAFFSGVIAIRTLINLLKRRKLNYFSYYCWMAGSLVILWSLLA